jgi:hypothetical protein
MIPENRIRPPITCHKRYLKPESMEDGIFRYHTRNTEENAIISQKRNKVRKSPANVTPREPPI